MLIWRSLLNAPPLDEILRDWLQILSQHSLNPLPESLDKRLRLLLEYMQQHRCLLVLDNVESILQPSQTNQPRAGEARAGYEGYALLFERLAVSDHRSCLLLTSREQPYALTRIGRETRTMRQLPLTGLDLQAGAAILQGSGLPASTQDADLLVKSYSGNPLALQIVANTIADFFGGDVTAFQREEGFVFDGIRAVLDQQFERLSELEREILVWLAVEREAVTVQTLREDFVQPVITSALLNALNALQARALLEKVGDGLTLQNVVIEYLTERLVSTVCAEIAGAVTHDQPLASPMLTPHTSAWLHRFVLSKAQAKEYVWQSQERLIVRPIFERLQKNIGQPNMVMKLQQILAIMREQAATEPATHKRGYAGGNILNLLLHAGVNLNGYDFSHLAVWQASLRQGSFSHVNLAYADLTGSTYIKPYNTIWSVAYSPDNRWLAGGSMEGPIFIWQVDDGQAAAVYHGHGSVVYSLAFSPDNTLLASGSQDQTIRLWDVRTGQIRFILHGQVGFVNSVAFSPDGTLLASGSDAHTVQLWRVETGELIATLIGHTERVNCVVFGADGKTLASCGDDQTIRIWEVAKGALLQTLHAQYRLHRIAYDSNAGLIVSSGLSPTLQFWQLATGECQETAPLCQTYTNLVSSDRVLVAMGQNRTWVASGSSGQNLRIWDAETRTPLRVLHGYGDSVLGLACSPDGQRLVAACENCTVCQWDVQTGALLQVFNGFGGRVDGLGFTASDELMVFSVQQGHVSLWQARGGAAGPSLSGRNDVNRPLALCPDRPLLICGDVNGIVSIWDWQAGRLAWQFEGHTKRISAFAAAHGGQLFATSNREDGVRIWDAQTRRLHQSLPLEDTNVCSLALSPDQTLLAVGSDSQTLLWETTQGQLLYTFTPDTDAPIGHNVAFSKDSRSLACGTGDRIIYIWDVATKQTRHIFQEHGGALFALAFSPDGTLLAAGCGDCYVYVWDVEQGQLRHRLGGHAGWVTQITFVGDGNTLATGSYDGTVKLWAVDTGACLETFQPNGPYADMNITGVTGISEAQKTALKVLGAIEG